MGIHNKLQALLQSYYVQPDPGDAGTIKVDRDLVLVELVSTGAETRTLAPPLLAGLRAVIRMLTDGGDIVITASEGLNVLLTNEVTFADVGDLLSLVSVSATTGYRWEILVNTGSVGLGSASESSTPSSSPSPSASVSATPSSSPSASESATPSASESATPSSSPSASESATPSSSESATPSSSPSAS